MVSSVPDNTEAWAQKKLRSGVVRRFDGAAAILKDGEESYCFLYDSRDDSKLRVPREWREYQLHKRVVRQEVRGNRAINVEKTSMSLYHEHRDGTCPLGLDQPKAPPAGVRPASTVAPADRSKPGRRQRHRGSRGR